MAIGGRQIITLTREELYDQVWGTPLSKLAPSFGLSAARLRKLCEKHKVPTPSSGYWARLKLGLATERALLPQDATPSIQVVRIDVEWNLRMIRLRQQVSAPVDDPDLIRLIEREREPKYRIRVPQQLRDPHPIIRRARDASAEGRDGCADIIVARGSMPRALRLMDSLFRALEKRGHKVGQRGEDGVRISFLGEEFGCSLREKTRRIRLTEEEKPKPRWRFETVPLVRYEWSGVFELKLTGNYYYPILSWQDDGKGRLEDRLNEIVARMIVAVQRYRKQREETAREQESRLIAERERKELERARQLGQARIARLKSMAEQWEEAKWLRSFIAAVREEAIHRHGSLEGHDDVVRWLEWAEEYAQSVDPMTASPWSEGDADPPLE
jgi:hypothetical protein